MEANIFLWCAVEISGRAVVQGVESDKAAKVMKLLESKMVRCWLRFDGVALFSGIVKRNFCSRFASVHFIQPIPRLRLQTTACPADTSMFKAKNFSSQAGV